MTTTRKQLIDYIKQGSLPPEHVQQALKLTDVYPAPSAWQHFLSQLFMILAGGAFGLSAIFFVAYNWGDIGRITQFGLIEMLIIAAVAGYYRFSQHRIIGKICLLMATLFLGALMALYGQTYQTGADPWQLFFNWALLILPWVLISRFA